MAGVSAKDIAKKLGLSPAAVSLALNGKPGVSENTRALVLEAAMQMGYTKAEAAPGAPAHRTICFIRYAGTIVNIAEHTSFSSFVLQGVEARAAELGYSTQVRYHHIGELYNPQTLALIRKADGVIFLGTDISRPQLPEIEQFLECLDSIPVVMVDNLLLCDRVDCVGNDNYGGARTAGRHLLRTGHKTIGYVRAKPRVRNFIEREHGIRAALEEAGLSLAVTVDVDISSEGAFQDFDAWYKKGKDLPEGLFCENDIIAAAVIRVLKKHGVHIPKDVSVVGFDDIPMCEMLDPPLSTVHSFKEELGAVAVEHLHRRLSMNEVPHHAPNAPVLTTTLSTRFVPRFSVGPKGSL
ncbi:MAG: LacI family DNA-binding transcriptional regulator [Oscillospiraceae bacterium]|nr:LacI family DNA-binding transcriptional regulator [Oscillospiraceae bacterium]